MDKNSLTMPVYRGSSLHVPLSYSICGEKDSWGVSYELPDDYAEHNDGNLSNLEQAQCNESVGPGPVLPGLSIKTFHSNLLFSPAR
jgi:hypothetical protein